MLVEKAVNASPGVAVGQAVFDADTAEKWAKMGKAVIMVRPETKPDDVHGMIAAQGILTSRGVQPAMRRWWHANLAPRPSVAQKC